MTSRGASDFVGRRIKDARMARGWTAKDLAARCAAAGAPEITTAVIANIETGRRDKDGRRRRDVTVDELLTLSYALEMSPAHLLRTGEWAKEQLAITASDGEVDAPDVAAWLAGEAPAPVRSLLGGGLARCASCGHALWVKRLENGGPVLVYHCINDQCPKRVTRRVDLIDDHVVASVLGVLGGLADRGVDPPDAQEWEYFALSGKQHMLRALLARVTVSPVPEPEGEFDPSSVRLVWLWESPADKPSEADA